jgi:hypothetical protein
MNGLDSRFKFFLPKKNLGYNHVFFLGSKISEINYMNNINCLQAIDYLQICCIITNTTHKTKKQLITLSYLIYMYMF